MLVSPQVRAGRAARRLVVALAGGALAAGCDEAPREGVLDQESHLSRQVKDLRALVARAEEGRLVLPDGLVVAVREDAVRRMTQLALPREQVLQERFRVRLERADVRFRDRHGAVRLEGRVGWADDAYLYGSDVSVDLTVFGRVEAATVESREGTLALDLVPIGFEIHQINVGEGQPTVRQLAESVARGLPESLSSLRSTVTIPVAFEHELRLVGREEGTLRFRANSLPLRLVVKDASAHGGRLWVSVAVEVAPALQGPRR